MQDLGQGWGEFIADWVSVPKREEQDTPILDPQRCWISLNREVATTGAEQVKDHILTAGKVVAPGRNKRSARRDAPFQFECIQYIGEHVHALLHSWDDQTYFEDIMS